MNLDSLSNETLGVVLTLSRVFNVASWLVFGLMLFFSLRRLRYPLEIHTKAYLIDLVSLLISLSLFLLLFPVDSSAYPLALASILAGIFFGLLIGWRQPVWKARDSVFSKANIFILLFLFISFLGSEMLANNLPENFYGPQLAIMFLALMSIAQRTILLYRSKRV